MAKFLDAYNAEKNNIARLLYLLDKAVARTPLDEIELVAIGGKLHNFYYGIENILKNTLKEMGITILNSESWHKDMLIMSIQKGPINNELGEELFEYLAFRHLFSHTYGFLLKEEKLLLLSQKTHNVWRNFLNQIEARTDLI